MKDRSIPALSFSIAVPTLALALLVAGTAEAQTADERTFGGLRFGAGLSVTFDTGDRTRVDSADVVNGIVRVTEESDVIPRLLLESHYFFPATERAFLGVKNPGTWAWGPFVGIQSSENDVIGAFAMGVMVGFRRETAKVEKAAEDLRVAKAEKAGAQEVEDKKTALMEAADTAGASSFNIGVGVMLDPHVKVLGDDIHENEPLPEGETEIRYKTTHQAGVVVMFSFSF